MVIRFVGGQDDWLAQRTQLFEQHLIGGYEPLLGVAHEHDRIRLFDGSPEVPLDERRDATAVAQLKATGVNGVSAVPRQRVCP